MTVLERIRGKLNRLRELDADREVFGASEHRYRLAPVVEASEVSAFEREFGVSLPDDYVAFLTCLGNGGAGPDYGLLSLVQAIEHFQCVSAFAKERGRVVPRLDREFPLNSAVADGLIACANVGKGLRRYHATYVGTPFLLDGILDICSRGCSVYVGLVLAGEQRGCVWGTGGEQGPSWVAYGPGRFGFLTWYEEWLDQWLAPGAIERLRSFGRSAPFAIRPAEPERLSTAWVSAAEPPYDPRD